MATTTQNDKIFDFIIRPIMVSMMNIQIFSFFVAMSAKMGVIRKSNFSISSNSVLKIAVFFSSWLTFITTQQRTKFFFKEFSSRFCERKIFSTIFASTCYLTLSSNRFKSTFFRTANCFCFRKSNSWNAEGFTTNLTNKISLLFLKIYRTVPRTKKIFIFFCFPELCFENFITKITIGFHIRQYNTQMVY
jgi:hypothetical protein